MVWQKLSDDATYAGRKQLTSLDNIFKYVSVNEKNCVLIWLSVKFVSMDVIESGALLVYVITGV